MKLYTYYGKEYEEVPRDVTHAIIAEGVTTIRKSAFDNCRVLVRVLMYDNVLTIEESALSHCESLVSVRLSRKLLYIGGWAFEGCYSLDGIFLPSTVKYIDNWAFHHCRSMRIFRLPATIEFVGKGIVDPYEDFLTSYKYRREGRIISNNDEVHESLKLRYEEYPLHKICYSTCVTANMVRACIREHGAECAQAIDEHRMTALHILAANAHASPEVVQACIEANSDATNIRDITGRYPVHYAKALNAGSFIGFVKSSLERNDTDWWFRGINEDSVGVISHLGLPLGLRVTRDIHREDIPLLHFLAKYPNPNVSLEVVRACYIANSEDATKRDFDGRYPIHYAALNQEPNVKTYISLLAEAQDRDGIYAASFTDDQNNTATALAVNYNASKEIQLYLYSVQPLLKSECATFEASERLAIVVEDYINMMETIIPTLGFSNYNIEFPMIKQIGLTQHIISLKCDHLIERWVYFLSNAEQCHVQSIKIMANFTDSLGRRMLEYAVPAIKDAILQRILFLGRYEIVKGPPIHKSDTSVVLKAFDSKGDDYYRVIFSMYADVEGRIGLKRSQFNELVEKFYGNVDESFADQVFSTFGHTNEILPKEDFVTFCRETFDNGQRRSIAIKLMKSCVQFEKEKDFRHQYRLKPDAFVRIEEAYNANEDDLFERAIMAHKDEVADIDLSEYKYAILMPFGDRNLDTIYRCEQPNEAKTRGYCKEIAEALKMVAANNICHGDLSLRNIVRFNNGRLKFVDLDASTNISVYGDDRNEEAKFYVGAKFSTGILPPEMICPFGQNDLWKKEKFENYFEEEKRKSSKFWNKIKPRISGQRGFLLKTFSVEEEVETDLNGYPFIVIRIKFRDQLPFDPVPTTEAIDLWSFGVLIYTVLTGKSLFEVNHTNDLANFRAFEDLACWNDAKKEERLTTDVADANARDLLMILLSQHPENRGSFAKTCTHSFFELNRGSIPEMEFDLDKFEGNLQDSIKGSVESLQNSFRESTTAIFSKLEEIERAQQAVLSKTLRIQSELKNSTRKMINAMFDATEVDTPTCFIILPYEIIVGSMDNATKAEKLMMKSLKIMKWIEGTRDKASRLKHATESYIDMLRGRKCYLYLIDEYSGKPITAAPYPLIVKVPPEKLKQYIPVMLIGLAGITILNTGLSLAKIFFPAIPSIPKSKMEEAQGLINTLKKKDLSMIERVAASGEAHTFRGGEARELMNFLLEKDKKCSFAGLKRVCDPHGNAIWVTEESANLIKVGETSEGRNIIEELRDLRKDNDEKTLILDDTKAQLKEAQNKVEEVRAMMRAQNIHQEDQEFTPMPCKRHRFRISFHRRKKTFKKSFSRAKNIQ